MIAALAAVIVVKRVPEHLRSGNGPEFVATDLRQWLTATGAKTLHIESRLTGGERLLREFQLRGPRRQVFVAGVDSKRRDEFLNVEIFYSKKEIRARGTEMWKAKNASSSSPPPNSNNVTNRNAALH